MRSWFRLALRLRAFSHQIILNESVAFAKAATALFMDSQRIRNKKGETVSSFGSGGLFLCYVITMIFLTIVVGWPALVILLLVAIGYAALLSRTFLEENRVFVYFANSNAKLFAYPGGSRFMFGSNR